MKRPLAVCLLILGCYIAECSVTAQEDPSLNDVSTAIYAPIRMCDGSVQFDEGLRRILGYFNLKSSVENEILTALEPFSPVVERYYWSFCDRMKPSIDRWRDQATKVLNILQGSPRTRRYLANIGTILGDLMTRGHEIMNEGGLVKLLQALWKNMMALPSNVMSSIRSLSWRFMQNVILPAIMQAITLAIDSGTLPGNVVESLNTINSIYHLLQMTGYFAA